MTHYVDGFVVPVPTARLDDYRKLAELAAKVWREHGALQVWNAGPTMCSPAR